MATLCLWLSLIPMILANIVLGNSLTRFVGGGHISNTLRARAALPVMEIPESRVARTNGHTLRSKLQSCGPGIGSCPTGFCCSAEGVCGEGSSFCAGPDCQFLYGPACDANQIPSGNSTSGIPRTIIGSIPYGTRINSCSRPNVAALTFDDGPYIYTSALLDLLDQYNAKATFFITGNNLGKGPIDNCTTGYPATIKRMKDSGHQIASHTWSHQNLNSLSATDFNNQMIYNEMALRNILGVIPTYMRPPYVDCNDGCFDRLRELGYHAIYYDLDTFDYANDSPDLIQNSKNNWANYINPHPSSVLELSHDIHYQTVYNLTKFMLNTMALGGYGTSVTVGTCLNDPPENWYRAAGSPITCGPPPALQVSTDGTCGNGITCQGSTFGNCCSKYNRCGSLDAWCGVGCQTQYGSCVFPTSSLAPSLSTTSTPWPFLSSTKISTVTSLHSSPALMSPTRSSTTYSSVPSINLMVSTDGKCGGDKTCKGSKYGDCCSRYNFCGSTFDHCGSFCQPSFGTCNPPGPSGTARVSTDGSCGKDGIICIGSTFGSCCSSYGFCGSTVAYCGSGCQISSGTCN